MPPIPENLMARLRAATEQFRRARLLTDDVDRMDKEQRLGMAAALRAAEKELEDVTLEINTFLPPTPQSASIVSQPSAGPEGE